MREAAIYKTETGTMRFRRHRLGIIALLLSVLFTVPTVYAQSGRGETQKRTEIITPYENKKAKISVSPEVVFLSTGPATSESTELRFILSLEEIYYSIVIEEIKHGSTEGDPVLLLHSYVISDADIKRVTDQQELMSLLFRRWITSSEFELEINKIGYRVQYTTARKFRITPVK